MLADDVAHSDCVDADLLIGALAVSGPAEIVGAFGADRADRIGYHKRRAAGGIKLSVMVLLDDLDICIGHSKHRALCKLDKQSNTERHICRVEHGDHLGSLAYRGKLLIGVSCRCNDGGYRALPCISKHRYGCRVVREIYNAVKVCRLGHRVKSCIYRAVAKRALCTVNAERKLSTAVARLGKSRNLSAHATGNSVYKYSHNDSFQMRFCSRMRL